MNNEYLYDNLFLRQLDLNKNKNIYAKIILLTLDELPVEEIQGKVTGGSINIDGASAVRRTCSLTMVAPKIDITNNYWALKNKFKLEIGIENNINPLYPDIIWFKQGTFVFTSLNMSVQQSNFNISLNGKDKMCLLNGEVDGSINAFIDFGQIEEYETLQNGEIVRNLVRIPIKEIIKNIIHMHAGEPLHNIVLKDIDEYGLELLEYRGDNNLYMLRSVIGDDITNLTIHKKQEYYLATGEKVYLDNTENINAGRPQIIYYDRTELNIATATKVWKFDPQENDTQEHNEAYNVVKVEFGEAAGYRKTELTYPGELTANVGETLMAVLDKIKNMFGDFEYFYDIDGRFIFQKKKTYVNKSWNNIKQTEDELYIENMMYDNSYVYSFEDGELLTAFSNAPNILNIKNDFSIWGSRKGATGAAIPIHMRYAIDSKPTYYKPIRFVYKNIELQEKDYTPNKYYIFSKEIKRYILDKEKKYDKNKVYYIESDEQNLNVLPFTSEEYDWREIIYQMALDYFKYNYTKNNFTHLVAAANPEYYPTGITGYENYYTDMQEFWRQLYHPGTIDQSNYYYLFSEDELYEAAREVILEERKFIEQENIDELIIDYIYENFHTIRNNFINTETLVEQYDNPYDFIVLIANYINWGFPENSYVIQSLLDKRWKKMEDKKKDDNTEIDDTDYDEIMNEEYEENGKSNLYKAYQYAKNYKENKAFLEKYKDTDISLEIAARIREGLSKNSAEIQNLLSIRWRKIKLTPPYEDNFDYLKMMEDEYAKNGDSSLYQTYLIMYDYRNEQNRWEIDNERVIMQEINGQIDMSQDSYLSFLYTSRQKKINNFEGEEPMIDNETFIWIIVTVIKDYENTKKANFKESVEKKIKQQSKKSTEDFSKELIKYVVDNYNNRVTFFLVDSNNKKVYIENSNIAYLLEMRQNKIDELGGDIALIDNELMVAIMLQLFETCSTASGFEEKMNEKMSYAYTILEDKDPYDFNQEVIDYIYYNYDNKDKFFYDDPATNEIEVKDQYLQYLLLMRQIKIDELDDPTSVNSNIDLVNQIFKIIKKSATKEEFKDNIEGKSDEEMEGEVND